MMQESLLEENKQATSSILSFASLYHLNKFIPQTLSLPLYLISVYSLQFLLIFLALSPPKSPFRLYIIYFILLIYFLLPLNYGYHFSCTINGVIPLTVITYTWKMLIWLKKCKYSSVKKDKIVGPYYHSLFWWRDSSFTVVNQEGKKTNHSNQKFIENHHTDQNNISGRYLFTRLISFIKFSIILEFWLIFIEYLMPKEIPSTPYPIRIFQYFTTSSSSSATSSTTTSSSYSDKLLFFQTSLYAFYCVIYVGILYWNMIWIYEFYLLVASCLLYYVQSIKKSSDSIFNHFTNLPSYNKLLNKLKIPQNFSSILEQWLQSFLFNTPPLFSSPHLSCSPSDFWSKRWHLLYRNCFVELGYSPCKRFINQHYPNSLPLKKEFAHIIGIFAGFWWSALFHEYMIHSLFGSANGEHFTFFLFHGIVAIGWEILVTILFKKFIKNDQKENKIIHHLKKIVGYILWNLILIFSAPWFAEPYIRAKHYYCYPHFGCDKHVKSI